MSARYVTNTYEITDAYKKILIDAKEGNVKIEASSDDSTKLVLFEDKKRPYVFDVQNGTLTVQLQKTRWYNLLRIGFKRSEIRIYVPKSILEELFVKSTVGSVEISSIVCKGDIDIQTNTGKANIYDILCKAFNSKANTGSIILNKLIAADRVSIKRNTGSVSLNDCNAREFFIKTNTGGVFGKLPSNTVFVVKTNTGKIEIPKATTGESISTMCEIRTHTGNIRFE